MELRKKYYGLTENHREIFIHRNSYPELVKFLTARGYDESRINKVYIPVPLAAPAEFAIKPIYVLRDYQEAIVETLAASMYSSRLDLQTGKGKTFCALSGVARHKRRVVIMIPPKYFGIWTKALHETFDDVDGKYCTVSGSAELQNVINRGLEDDLPFDFIIISSVTYRSYIESYERLTDGIVSLGYNVPPPRFHEAIKAGVQINDEFQEDPGLVFRIDMFTNVAKQIYLSATPYTGNSFVTQMIDVMLPPETMCELPAYDSYCNVVGFLYSDVSVQPKDYLTPYKNTYNHARYETQMLKNKRRTQAYFEMLKRLVNGVYARDKQPNQKLLILCATVNFIEHLVKYLKAEFPDLQVNKHVQGCNFKLLQTNDITVSTIKSSGTGVDIINLREVILCHATDSKKDNIQIMGRLRKIRDYPDVTPRLSYLVCNNIPNQLRYHANKFLHFEGKTKTHKTMRLS